MTYPDSPALERVDNEPEVSVDEPWDLNLNLVSLLEGLGLQGTLNLFNEFLRYAPTPMALQVDQAPEIPIAGDPNQVVDDDWATSYVAGALLKVFGIKEIVEEIKTIVAFKTKIPVQITGVQE